jgi:hypothetical protein
MRHGGLATVVAMILVSGCSAAPAAVHRAPVASSSSGFWSRTRLLDARPLLGGQRLAPQPGQTPDSHTALVALRVGALFERDAEHPITCLNWTSRQSATQLRFDCGGYTGGTSGSPWVTHFDSRSRTGTIVGVIGGYQQGGDTPAVSYSAYLSTSIHLLYEQAISDGTSTG